MLIERQFPGQATIGLKAGVLCPLEGALLKASLCKTLAAITLNYLVYGGHLVLLVQIYLREQRRGKVLMQHTIWPLTLHIDALPKLLLSELKHKLDTSV